MDQNNISYSMFIDDFNKSIHKKHKIRIVEPKTIYHWVEDDAVTKCYQCGVDFGFFTRKHHCRNCGRIFCYNCSNYFMILKNNKTHKLLETIRKMTYMENQPQKYVLNAIKNLKF